MTFRSAVIALGSLSPACCRGWELFAGGAPAASPRSTHAPSRTLSSLRRSYDSLFFKSPAAPRSKQTTEPVQWPGCAGWAVTAAERGSTPLATALLPSGGSLGGSLARSTRPPSGTAYPQASGLPAPAARADASFTEQERV